MQLFLLQPLPRALLFADSILPSSIHATWQSPASCCDRTVRCDHTRTTLSFSRWGQARKVMQHSTAGYLIRVKDKPCMLACNSLLHGSPTSTSSNWQHTPKADACTETGHIDLVDFKVLNRSIVMRDALSFSSSMAMGCQAHATLLSRRFWLRERFVTDPIRSSRREP